MSNIIHKEYARGIIDISGLFSSYYQKKIILTSYNNFKIKKKFNEITKIYENWFIIHNINY